MIFYNGRILDNKLTGAQRYLLELTSRFGARVELIKPLSPLHGVGGHIWEQMILPLKVANKGLLWSPSITGPLITKHQVVTIFDVVPLDHPEWVNFKFASWYKFVVPKLARNVEKILTISEFSKSRIIHHCPEVESKIEVITLAADSKFKPASVDQSKYTQERLSIPSPNYFIAVGSLEPRKNLHRLLMAWKLALNYIPEDNWLIVVGAIGKKNVFGGLDLGEIPTRVFFTGHVDDILLPSLYSGAIASIYLSLYEGFGLPPLEAMASGAPVLTSNVASIPEVVGNAALLVNPLDVYEIKDSIINLANDVDIRFRLREAGLIRASLFSWDVTANKTLNVLKECE
jgi:glycosyltransferase involved in cell wall biosynthesis